MSEHLREAILRNPKSYMVIGDMDKPFHLPECECERCEQWRKNNDRPTYRALRTMLGEES